jgi:hypothetical protein
MFAGVAQGWVMFTIKPVYGDVEIQTPCGRFEAYDFTWKEGMQSWRSNEYDDGLDTMRMEGKQIGKDTGMDLQFMSIGWILPGIFGSFSRSRIG